MVSRGALGLGSVERRGGLSLLPRHSSLREVQGLSQSGLAEAFGIPQSTISAIENGRVNLGVAANPGARAS